MAKSRAPRGVFGERVTPRTPDRSSFTPPVFGAQWERKNTRAGSWQGFDNPPPDDTPTVVSDPTVNVAPVIGATPDVTPAVWSSGTSDTVRWEMADTDAGPWSTVDDMPAIDTPYTDQTFGKVLRWVEAQGGVTAESAATAAVAEAPVIVSAANSLTNGDFSDGTGTFPNGWTFSAGTSGGDPGISEVAPGGGAGTGAAKYTSTATTTSPRIFQSVLSVGAFYVFGFEITAYTSGLTRSNFGSTLQTAYNAVGANKSLGRSAGTQYEIRAHGAAPHNFTIDNAFVRALTMNGQLAAPSANMDVRFLYTLPVTPVAGEEIRLFVRVSDFAAGNYFSGVLLFTGTQWNLNLYRVDTFTRTSIIAATNIGSTNGMRIVANANAWELFSTANSGGAYTSRGTVTDAAYNTATGVNVLYDPNTVTAGLLSYVNP